MLLNAIFMLFKEKNTKKESFQIEIIFLKLLKFASLMVWDLAENKNMKPVSQQCQHAFVICCSPERLFFFHKKKQCEKIHIGLIAPSPKAISGYACR